MKKTLIHAERVNFGQFVHLHMAVKNGELMAAADPCTFTNIEEGSHYGDPMIRLEPDQAQMLADELWRIGFRPTQGKQSEGAGEAIGRHLQDMRTIAFSKLNVEIPK